MTIHPKLTMSRSPHTEDEIAYAVQLGQRITAARCAAKMSQSEFATELCVGRNTIWRWETGRAMPNAYQLHVIRTIESVHNPKAKETM